ncbi:MAG: sulfatase-like hydrolase/transferase [Acidimicrobiia bacterium]|nr:sulfatase-like hydrolase/transferase [Acidimicrobiia bacterium]
MPAWDGLPADERRLYTRMMEVFAGFLTHADAQIGRLLDHLEATGLLDDTLVLLLSDNGASAEGGPTGSFNEHRFTHDLQDDVADTIGRVDDLGGFRAYNHYPWGWAWAGNTPLRLWKRFTWLGGVRTPLIAHWPRGIEGRGAVRSQFCHAVDLMPTVLEATGVGAPATVDGVAQRPLDGASLLPVLADPDAPSPRRTQYFEILGSRAVYHDGWKATTDHVGNQITVERELVEGSTDFATDRWSLFHLDDDFSEARDLADEEPERLRDLVERWLVEAGRNQVMPLDDSFVGRAVALEPAPGGPLPRGVYRPGGGPVAEDALPPMGGGFRIAAEVEVPDGGAEGVVCALGDWSNGWACYLLDGRPVVTLNLFGHPVRVAGERPLPPGTHTVGVTYERRGGGGPLVLHVDGEPVAEGHVPRDLPFRWQIGGGGLLVGRDRGFPVCDDYRPPFPCTGTVHHVVIESSVLRPRDAEAEVRRALHHE